MHFALCDAKYWIFDIYDYQMTTFSWLIEISSKTASS